MKRNELFILLIGKLVMSKRFKDCVLIERRNWHEIYLIDKELWLYWVDFCDWWGTDASCLEEAEKISDDYYQIWLDQENEGMEDMVAYEDTF